MDAADRRAEKRVRPPHDALLDFALWPAPASPPSRLMLAALGMPAASRCTGDSLVVADATALGLGLYLSAPLPVIETFSTAPALFVYLKLRDFRPQAPSEHLSLFFYALLAHAEVHPEGFFLGMRLSRQGRGSSFEKALELLDISRYGVPELVSWIDTVVREWRRPETAPSPGLDLDSLLDEPECHPLPATAKRNAT